MDSGVDEVVSARESLVDGVVDDFVDQVMKASRSRRPYVHTGSNPDRLEAFQDLALLEGLMPALESAHALAYAMKEARRMKKSEVVVVGLSGRGDKDVHTVGAAIDGKGNGHP